MREVQFYLAAYNVRSHNSLAFEAGLHGIKIDLKESSFDSEIHSLTPEQEQIHQRAINDAMERKMKERHGEH